MGRWLLGGVGSGREEGGARPYCDRVGCGRHTRGSTVVIHRGLPREARSHGLDTALLAPLRLAVTGRGVAPAMREGGGAARTPRDGAAPASRVVIHACGDGDSEWPLPDVWPAGAVWRRGSPFAGGGTCGPAGAASSATLGIKAQRPTIGRCKTVTCTSKIFPTHQRKNRKSAPKRLPERLSSASSPRQRPTLPPSASPHLRHRSAVSQFQGAPPRADAPAQPSRAGGAGVRVVGARIDGGGGG